MARIEGTEKIGVSELGAGRVKALVGLYDFALDGGAVGDITLRGEQLPINAIVVDALLEVDTVLTSAGAPTGLTTARLRMDREPPTSTLGRGACGALEA